MNSGTPSKENLEQLVEEIKSNLRLVNASIIRPEDFDLDQYEDLLEIHRLIQKKEGRLTMMEIEGILEELRELRANAK
ncbi:DUF1128 family protein [Thermoactinomyces intermedius]|uniref:DUF1128 family protein n=1 Tax=Thermoactinomyces intermedius TaxID=2024 RepID=A0A8I1A5P9_THEIN|nr:MULTISPECIES: DUF1128 family protein [Thermoactinomyces]MBA4548450.1 DUF1128 family protein [Thermoactinomyces intermedius]MBA4837539.1 DUF1128 family protein [Thermoactinomyces intermedius]MBH8595294.1 DUF1128 family protein [Thermoactinomyces intermedius]MBH8601765.1 DUF1128 family protein [Thermoactinomyces sp. CICC 23799]